MSLIIDSGSSKLNEGDAKIKQAYFMGSKILLKI